MIEAIGRQRRRVLSAIFVAALAMAGSALAGRKPAVVAVTERGEQLAAQYEKTMATLREELTAALPKVDAQKKAVYQDAREADVAAKVALDSAKRGFGEIKKAEGAVAHAKGKWIGGAEAGIAKAEAMFKESTTDAGRDAAQKELAKWQENRKAGLAALKERQAALDKAKSEEPRLVKELEESDETLEVAQASLSKAANDLDLASLLESDESDNKLAKYVVLLEATPRGLAAFAQQGKEQEKLVAKLLADENLMVRMLTAGGAKDGKYGESMRIYSDIQKTSKRASEAGVLQNLALGISLELVVPYQQGYGTFMSRGRPAVDPVQRYLHYEKAFLAGELDPAFKDMTAWECRWIASDPSSDEELAWLRKMMRNYRPDLLAHPDPQWYYTRIIKTDVAYRRPKWDTSAPVSERMQQAVDKGGICHIRAWVARSTGRAFGIPVRRVEDGGARLPVKSSKR